VKLGKNASDTCVVLSEAYGGEALKSQVFLSGINSAKRVSRMWKMMKTLLITFFNIKDFFTLNSFHKASQPNLSYGNTEVVT